MEKTYGLTLDFYNATKLKGKISFVRGDIGVYALFITLVVEGKPFIIPGDATVNINFKSANGNGKPIVKTKRIAEIIDRTTGEIKLILDGSEFTEIGTYIASVSVISAGQKLTCSQQFEYAVIEDLDGDGIDPPDAYKSWTDNIMQRITALEDSANNGTTPPIDPDPSEYVTIQNIVPALSESAYVPVNAKFISLTDGVLTVENTHTGAGDITIQRPTSVPSPVAGNKYYSAFRACGRTDTENTPPLNFYQTMTGDDFVTVVRNEWADYAFVLEFPNGFGSWRMYAKDHSFVPEEFQIDFSNPIIVNLTEAFGAGNEPDIDWCKENIPYFVGSMEVPMLKKNLTP